MTALTEAHGAGPLTAPFNAVKIEFPGYTARVWSGLNGLDIDGETYLGAGKLLGVGSVGGSLNGGAERPAIYWTTTNAVDRDELSDYVVQGSPVFIYFGQLDRALGTIKGVRLIFAGLIDQPRIKLGKENRIEIRCMGAREYAKRRDARRWNPADQESVYAGDTFFKHADDGNLPFRFGDKNAPNPRANSGGGYQGGASFGGVTDRTFNR